ncbi:MAG: hypothetical protein JW991_03475 [Candidatus Pacebacteria bacterium]|nr:hypothetical protein [Candidatus Paceibacterota bacterium]
MEAGEPIAPQGERVKSLDKVAFKGLSPEQAGWVKQAAERIGLPTDNVTSIVYRENLRGEESVLGQVHLLTGELTLFKALGKLPERAQISTLAHELAHENDPFLKENIKLYGSEEAWEQAQKHASAIAEQTKQTRVYLNGYHKMLHQMLMAGQISELIFARETHAILIEIRLSNPKHMIQVQEAQRDKLIRQNRQNKFITMMEPEEAENGTPAVGVDRTLISLIAGVNNLAELNSHVAQIRNSFSPTEKGPLSQ